MFKFMVQINKLEQDGLPSGENNKRRNRTLCFAVHPQEQAWFWFEGRPRGNRAMHHPQAEDRGAVALPVH